MKTVRLGSSGKEVAVWQATLNDGAKPSAWLNSKGLHRDWGVLPWPIPENETFDEVTEAATEAWQAARGLVADGVVGPKTWNSAGAQTEASVPKPSETLVQAKNYSRGRPELVRMVIVHTAETREDKKSARGTANWFANQPARGTRLNEKFQPDPEGKKLWGGTSAHYCVDDQEVLQCVAEEDTAWHAGAVNGYSVGVEHAGRAEQTPEQWADAFSSAMLERSAKLVAGICIRHGIPARRLTPDELLEGRAGIAGHVDVTRAFGPKGGHSDPGPNFPWERYIGLVEKAMVAERGTLAPKSAPDGEILWSEVELDGDVWLVARDYIHPVSLAEAEQLAKQAGCELPSPALVDAIWGAADLRLNARKLVRSDFTNWTMAEMSSPSVLEEQEKRIAAQIAAETAGGTGKDFLLAGSHKDVVRSKDGRLGLYGWQDDKGTAVQPFFAGHVASWCDYSQGLRLVKRASACEPAQVPTKAAPTAEFLAAAILDVPVEALMPRARSRGLGPGPSRDLPIADEATLAALESELDSDPEGLLPRARSAWDSTLTEAGLRQAVWAAKGMVAQPLVAAKGIEGTRTRSRGRDPMPPEFDFPGYDRANIPLDVESTKFETRADAPAWVVMSGSGIVGSFFGKKAPFERHSHERLFHYARPAPTEKPVKIALFSDFATGLAHSRYIAKHLTRDAETYDCAIHLGDVYYAGRESETREYFVRPLEELTAKTTFFGLPGNHEMYSNGHPYFEEIRARRLRHPEKQMQQGSYFSLQYGNNLQIVGIDTDYFSHGRYEDPELRVWLDMVLRWGREAGRTNVLLTGNEPFTYGKNKTTDLYEDLKPFLPMVDLWFWGNDHYCALFDKTADLPVSGCIGHGGYPYHLSEYGLDPAMTLGPKGFAPALWAEAEPRYPRYTGVRQNLGNNGYLELEAYFDRRLVLTYKDWTARERKKVILAPKDGRLSVERMIQDNTL